MKSAGCAVGVEATEKEIAVAKAEAYQYKYAKAIAAARLLGRLAEMEKMGVEFPTDVSIVGIGESLFHLLPFLSGQDPLLLLIEGWRRAEHEEFSEQLQLMY